MTLITKSEAKQAMLSHCRLLWRERHDHLKMGSCKFLGFMRKSVKTNKTKQNKHKQKQNKTKHPDSELSNPTELFTFLLGFRFRKLSWCMPMSTGVHSSVKKQNAGFQFVDVEIDYDCPTWRLICSFYIARRVFVAFIWVSSKGMVISEIAKIDRI